MNFPRTSKIVKGLCILSLSALLIACGDDSNDGGETQNQLQFSDQYQNFNQQTSPQYISQIRTYEAELARRGLVFNRNRVGGFNTTFGTNAFVNGEIVGNVGVNGCFFGPNSAENRRFDFSFEPNKRRIYEYHDYMIHALTHFPPVKTPQYSNYSPYLNNNNGTNPYYNQFNTNQFVNSQQGFFAQQEQNYRISRSNYLQILLRLCSLQELMRTANIHYSQLEPGTTRFYEFNNYNGDQHRFGCQELAANPNLVQGILNNNLGTNQGTFLNNQGLNTPGSIISPTTGGAAPLIPTNQNNIFLVQ